MEDAKDLANTIENWTTNILVIVASVFFLAKFYTLNSKNYGLYMILILNLIDLTFSFSNIIVINFVENQDIQNTYALFGPALYRFSLFWSTAIAYFVFLVVRRRSIFDPKRFITKALLLCLFLASIVFIITSQRMFGLALDFSKGIIRLAYPTTGTFNRIMYVIIIEFLCTVAPIFVTFYFYHQVYKVLKTIEAESGEPNKSHPINVMWYVVIQIFCFGTGAVVDVVSMALQLDKPPFVIQFIASTCRRTWGFLNLLGYWYLRYTEEDNENNNSREGLMDDTKLLADERSSISSRVSEIEM